MKKKAYKDKSVKDLEKALVEKREALRAFKFNISGSRTTDVKEARSIRREIAQILTALNLSAKAEDGQKA